VTSNPQISGFRRKSTATVGTTGQRICRGVRICVAHCRYPGVPDAHLQQEVDRPAFLRHDRPARAPSWGLNASTVRHQAQCQPELLGAGDTPNF